MPHTLLGLSEEILPFRALPRTTLEKALKIQSDVDYSVESVTNEGRELLGASEAKFKGLAKYTRKPVKPAQPVRVERLRIQ